MVNILTFGYFYDNDGYVHYYASLDELLDEARFVLGDDYVRALKEEMDNEVQRQIDDWTFLNGEDDDEGDY